MALRLEDVRLTTGAFALSADFAVAAGARAAIIGPSGGGKSTLLDIIAGFRAPDRGRVWWDDSELTGVRPAERPVAILFQDANLFPHLTVARNLSLALRPGTGRLTSGDAARIDAVLDRVGLAGFGGRRPGELSGGQQSRAALARVLLQDRPVLLLDEPFSALGPALRREMLDLVTEMCAGREKTVLLVTHDPEEALRFADQALLMIDGLAHALQDATSLFEAPPPALAAYLGARRQS